MPENTYLNLFIEAYKGARVLVTGATGFTGSFLAEQLCSAGAEVTAIHRRDNIPDSLKSCDIRWVQGNVYDEECVVEACRDIDYVFHVAAAYRESGIDDDVYRKVHVASTQLIAAQCQGQKNFKRFIHVSTVGVHGHIDGEPADEQSRFAPGDIYQETKAEAELWIRDFAKKNSLPLSVIRPAAIYGPGDRRLLKVFKMAALPVIPILGFGKGYYHLIHRDDLVACLMLAGSRPEAEGEVFICGNESPVRLKEMIREIAGGMNRRPLFIHLPAWPFFLVAHLCEAICRPLKLSPIIYPRRVAFFTKDRAFNTQKLRDVLSLEYCFDNATGLKNTLEWYQTEGWI